VHGTDENLNEARAMRYAGRFARRVHAFTQKNDIALIKCQRGDRKHEIAEQHIPADPNFTGLFCVLVGRAPAPVREIQRHGNGYMNIRLKKPLPYVNHYYFHIIDPEWGHIGIKFCPHPPFNAQIMLNGHEFVERAARERKISFVKDGNCFTDFSDAAGLARVADTMIGPEADVGRLVQVCERWIYTCCLCFALDLADQERCDFRYSYSVFQAEYSRNYLFRHGRKMEKLFDGLIDRTRVPLDIKSLKTIFGVKNRPYFKDRHGQPPRIELAIEKPAYNLTVFKIHFGVLTVKMYTKGERVLRLEVIVHNAKRLRCGVGIDRFSTIIGQLKDVLTRFVDVLRCVDLSFVDAAALDKWHKRSKLAGKPVAGIDLNGERMRVVLEAVIALAAKPHGFKACEVAAKATEMGGRGLKGYASRQASYDLKKLRAKRIVERIPDSLRYQVIPRGLRTITAMLVLRSKVMIPLLANRGQRKRCGKCHMSEADQHYDNIQKELQHVFNALGIAA
jgi:hypothetical protein